MKLQIDNARIWQIGSGDETRSYSDICLNYGIAMVGPGGPGDARKPETAEFYKKTSWRDWGSYLLEIAENDYVILRRGMRRILAVGRVTKPYDYSELLSDVHGWDLNHYITVEWYTPINEINFNENALPQATMSRVYSEKVIQRIKKEDFRHNPSKFLLSDLQIPKRVEPEELVNTLINNGVRIGDAENIILTISRIIKLTKWYLYNNPSVLEHELRTFLVIPLLISLGWSEQKIKIEYKKADIAVFKKSYYPGENHEPTMILESKTFYDGLKYARNQVQYYSQIFPDCKMLISTNGFRYVIEEKVDDSFHEKCYLNLLDLREHYYLDPKIKGSAHALLQMSNF